MINILKTRIENGYEHILPQISQLVHGINANKGVLAVGHRRVGAVPVGLKVNFDLYFSSAGAIAQLTARRHKFHTLHKRQAADLSHLAPGHLHQRPIHPFGGIKNLKAVYLPKGVQIVVGYGQIARCDGNMLFFPPFERALCQKLFRAVNGITRPVFIFKKYHKPVYLTEYGTGSKPKQKNQNEIFIPYHIRSGIGGI